MIPTDEFMSAERSSMREADDVRSDEAMSRVIVSEFLTLDGVMQAPGGTDEDTRGGFQHGGWQMQLFDDALGQFVMGGISSAGGLLLGRRTYEIFAAHWPNQPDDDPLAPTLNALRKYVASRTLQAPLDWENSTLLEGDAADAVAKLKEQPGDDLLVIGSGDLVQTLIEHDLVDAYRLMVHPLLLGGGRRLFPSDGSTKRPLRLVDSSTSSTGVLILTYEPGMADDSQGEGGQ
jgi:dihydrofolate reductase